MLNHIKNIVTTVYTAAIGSGSREIATGVTSAGTGLLAMAAGWLGGYDKPLEFLVVLMLADYVSGVAGAIKTKTVSSNIMFWGGVRKINVLFVVGLVALIDDWVQLGEIKELGTTILELTDTNPPKWSLEAIQALHDTPSVINGQPVIDTPDVATKTEARIFTVLHRLGLAGIHKGAK